MHKIDTALDAVLSKYQSSFEEKTHNLENEDHDPLMDAFGISPDLKRENRQYWGRELGMCWQLIVTELCRITRDDFSPPKRFGADEPYDLSVGSIAIDTKYRIGSGDSGTLKKFKSYGPLLREHGYEPRLLIVRDDNLKAAITACKKGGWKITTGEESFDYIKELTGFDMMNYLRQRAEVFRF